MCSFTFVISKKKFEISEIDFSNFLSQKRGPDYTNIRRELSIDGRNMFFLHNLLDISGQTIKQPLLNQEFEPDTFALFNGEIYNFKDFGNYKADSACILPQFEIKRNEIRHEFDGEFSIGIFEKNNNKLTVLTDPFLTKPLYYGFGLELGDFGIATCASSLLRLGFKNVSMFNPNELVEIDLNLDGVNFVLRQEGYFFDTKQYKTDYNDWNSAFFKSVAKRALHGAHLPMVFLSSGYDSGGICLALNQLKIKYDTFSILAGENTDIIFERNSIKKASLNQGKSYYFKGISEKLRNKLSNDILLNVEPFEYVHEDSPGFINTLQNDGGAIGGNFIAGKARQKRRFVNLSGTGADEILSDYGFNGEKIYHHSEFGGKFPEDLSDFFPWKKFYGDTQRSYLFKDEYILGRHGIEGRYPYLDRHLVQEFLWLSPELKNKIYKSPLANLFEINNYPFEPSVKRGFAPSIAKKEKGEIWNSIKGISKRILNRMFH